jgi:heptosyltransferase-1
MDIFQQILIYHIGAIGDIMLASPIAAVLRKNFPKAYIAQISHPEVLELISLCGKVDNLIAYDKQQAFFKQYAQVANLEADLIIDLSGSLKSTLLTQFNAAKVLHYRKQSQSNLPIMHAVDNFLLTLNPLKLEQSVKLFPTLTIPETLITQMQARLNSLGVFQPIVACIPGVGKFRSHRAWTVDKWIATLTALLAKDMTPVLLGGSDEDVLCKNISKQTGAINLAGKLSLVETAAVLKVSYKAISADTGPAHIAVAVGTPVVGLYGPTFIERSGPYGCEHLCLSQTSICQCTQSKSCKITKEFGPGYCMSKIEVEEVLARI